MNTITVLCPDCGREETVEVADEGATTRSWGCAGCGRRIGVSAQWQDLPEGRRLFFTITTNSGGALPAIIWESE